MIRLAIAVAALGAALLARPDAAVAQSTASSVAFPAGYAPGSAPCARQADESCVPVTVAAPLPTAGKQESFALVSGNVPNPPATVHGGTYAVSQGCASYGTTMIRYRGPDGATMMPLLSRTATDANGATLVSLGSNAVIDAIVSGTTGCNVTLARVPN